MILAVDVHYQNDNAVIAGVAFEKWSADRVRASYISSVSEVSPYAPGFFYRRELPCILALLSEHQLVPDTIIIDGYVYLDGRSLPGLGRHLYDALQHRVSIIGVAKKPYRGITDQHKVFRGHSRNPLYVTTVGMRLDAAKRRIENMHGKYRIPSLLKLADRLARQGG